MKVREVTIFSGHRFDVPQCIQRIDHRATHGWQLRYGGTKLYSDHSNDGSGAEASLLLATKELLRRIAKLPAPTTLQRGPSANKSSKLPPGISGPILRARASGQVKDCSYAVLLPRYGKKPVRRSIYIGTEQTTTRARNKEALAEAVAMRLAAEEKYRLEATKARRAEARQFDLATVAVKGKGAPPAAKPVAKVAASRKSAAKPAAKPAAKRLAKPPAKKAAKTIAKKASKKS
jgi:hypothetical protein